MDADQDQLLSTAMQGNQSSLQRLLLANYEGLAEQLRHRIPMQLRATVDVEDILQVTFMHVFRDFSNFQGVEASAFRGWVRTIADARLVDAIRAATRQKRGRDRNRLENSPVSTSQSFMKLLDLLSDQKRSPSQSVAANEAVEALRIAVAGLPQDQRDVVWARFIENLTLDEVAEQVGRTEAAVRGLLHRGKLALKKSMGNSSAWFSKLDG